MSYCSTFAFLRSDMNNKYTIVFHTTSGESYIKETTDAFNCCQANSNSSESPVHILSQYCSYVVASSCILEIMIIIIICLVMDGNNIIHVGRKGVCSEKNYVCSTGLNSVFSWNLDMIYRPAYVASASYTETSLTCLTDCLWLWKDWQIGCYHHNL